MDITRDILNKLPQENEKIKKLQEILRKGQKYPIVPLDAFIIAIDDKIKPSQYPDDEFIVLGVANDKGIFVNEKKKGEEINQSYYIVRRGYFCYNPYRVNVGSIGLNEYDYDNQIISGAYNVFKVDEKNIEPKYLLALFKSKKFLHYVNELATGGVRMDFKIDYLKKWKIPLPPLEIQKEIVEKIEKQKAIIEGADKILENWEVEIIMNDKWNKANLSDIAEVFMGQSPESEFYNENSYGIPFYQGKINFNEIYISTSKIYTTKITQTAERHDILMSVRAPVGPVNIFTGDKCCIGRGLAAIRIKKEAANLKYVFYYLKSIESNIGRDTNTGSIFDSINKEKIMNIKIPLPPLEIQQKIVEELDKEMEALEKVKLLKEKAEKRIEEILNEVWGKS